MKRAVIAVLIVCLASLILASSALAFSWLNVGGDPLVPGGVWSKQSYVNAMEKPLVKQRFHQVLAGNGQPDWVLAKAFALAKDVDNVRQGTIQYGEYVGTMGSGHSVDYRVTYLGQYRPLATFYVQPKKTTTVKINGNYYKKTVRYQVVLAKPCGNALIIHKRVKLQRLYELRVEKRLDTVTGERLAGWIIQGKAGGKEVEKTTKSTGSVLVGRYLAGTKYNLSEVLVDGWEIVSPANGNFAGSMPKKNLVLKFVNKEICPPPPPPCYDFGTKGYWHNKNGLSELTAEDISYVNTLAPYADDRFDGKDADGNPVPAIQGAWGEELAPAGSWQAEVSAYLVAPNAGGDPTIQLGQQLLAFIFNAQHRLGSMDVELTLPDGTVMTAGEIIEAAVTAWETGGEEAGMWASILDGFNNMDE
jgi:hypothetical protein